MFSTIVSLSAFTITSLAIIALILDAIVNRKYNRMQRALGYRYSFYKLLVIGLIWFATGWYLWG